MKTCVILALLALFAVPAFADESAPPPAPLNLAASSSPACAPVTASTQNSDLPSWLTEKPLLWSEDLERMGLVSAGCAAYCRECGGCCAILGPGVCACC
jgi:hypothetical protein